MIHTAIIEFNNKTKKQKKITTKTAIAFQCRTAIRWKEINGDRLRPLINQCEILIEKESIQIADILLVFSHRYSLGGKIGRLSRSIQHPSSTDRMAIIRSKNPPIKESQPTSLRGPLIRISVQIIPHWAHWARESPSSSFHGCNGGFRILNQVVFKRNSTWTENERR